MLESPSSKDFPHLHTIPSYFSHAHEYANNQFHFQFASLHSLTLRMTCDHLRLHEAHFSYSFAYFKMFSNNSSAGTISFVIPLSFNHLFCFSHDSFESDKMAHLSFPSSLIKFSYFPFQLLAQVGSFLFLMI